jgi:hypothetical protein
MGIAMISYGYHWRTKIYNVLSKNRIGEAIMTPIMLPYVLYAFWKMVQDPFWIKLLDKIKHQKQITDYF